MYQRTEISSSVIRLECPVCGCGNVQSEKVFKRDYRGYRSIAPFSFYNVYVCPVCGMVYAGDLEVSMPIHKYYEKMSRYEGDSFVLSSAIEEYYKRCADFIVDNVDKSNSILDVGCAFGGLLNILKQRGFSRVFGLEPSEKNVQYAKNQFGITVYQGGLGKGKYFQDKYDVVILSGVLEHLVDCNPCIREVKNYLNDDGKLVVVVPDLEDFENHADIYQEFSVEHINYFNLFSIENMMHRYNMRLKDVHHDRVPVYGLAGNLFTIWQKEEDKQTDLVREKESSRVDETRLQVKRYLDLCQTTAEKVENKMSSWKFSDGFYIWGAGTQTAMLYQLGIIDSKLVHGIFDSNENYYGEEIFGCKIQKIDQLKMLPNRPIMLSSQYAQDSMKRTLDKAEITNTPLMLF